MTPPPSILVALALVTFTTTVAGAQKLVLSGAVQRDIQEFSEEDVPNRLDGSATGWMVGAAIRLRSHLALAVEWSDAGTIEDARTTTLDIDGRTIAITSTFRHHTRTAAALVDRFQGATGGVDTLIRISGRFHAVAGVRAQRISLPRDVSGWSVRTFVGAGWGL